MKAILSTLTAFLLLLQVAQAQTEKGIYMLGGTTNLLGSYPGALPNQVSLGFGTNERDQLTVKYTNFNLSTNGGYFIANGLLLGLNLSAFHGNTKSTLAVQDLPDIVIKHEITDYAIAPFVRYYINRGNKIQYFGEGRVGLGSQKVDQEDPNTNVLVGAKLGVAMFLNKKVALDFFYDFSGAFSEETQNGRSTNTFDAFNGFGFGFDVFL